MIGRKMVLLDLIQNQRGFPRKYKLIRHDTLENICDLINGYLQLEGTASSFSSFKPFGGHEVPRPRHKVSKFQNMTLVSDMN